jgi:hypothetical protein
LKKLLGKGVKKAELTGGFLLNKRGFTKFFIISGEQVLKAVGGYWLTKD